MNYRLIFSTVAVGALTALAGFLPEPWRSYVQPALAALALIVKPPAASSKAAA